MISLEELSNILDNDNPDLLEDLAQKSRDLTEQQFGRAKSLYAPIYLSNFCSSYCTYCGFHSHNRIKRFKLNPDQMHKEMGFVADKGIENILLLTGESYQMTPLPYLIEAVGIAKEYFTNISLEVHPMQTHEYRELFECGVDGVTVYQETYDRKRYSQVHVSGTKSDYDFRYSTPQRAAKAGIRTIAMGILLGLADTAEDLFALLNHLKAMERTYPGAEYSVSFPRIKPIKGENFSNSIVEDRALIKIICLTRTLFPRVGINLSTRENSVLRDHALELGVTRLSAGSNTSVGGYTVEEPDRQHPQFDIDDHRSVKETVAMLKSKEFDPVFTDWRRIPNKVSL